MLNKIYRACLFTPIIFIALLPFAFCESLYSLATLRPANTGSQNDSYTPLSKTDASWNEPVKPFKIIGNIYYVGASDVTVYLITTPQGHILIDSGFSETVPQIKANVKTLGFNLSDIKILLNGHAHYDHCGGLAELKELSGAKFMSMAEDVEILAHGGKGDFSFGDKFKFRPVVTDRQLHDGDIIELGGIKIVAHHTPGHTKGCTTWTMKVNDGGKDYDVVFTGSVSVPGHQLVDNQRYPNIVDDYKKSFGILKKLPCDIFLAQHGNFFELKAKAGRLSKGPKTNPFIDPQGYINFVNQAEKNFFAELKQQQATKADKK
jgi:metallo-beta-lactamase class B